jgi:methoxymalonate biosynthesis protein
VIKCVVWDIDNTVLSGTYLESPDNPPRPDPVIAAVLRELESRGVLHALASRNPPEAADYVRQVTGIRFAAARCGWGSKADSIAAIIAELDLTADTVAFVDDDMIERAEVAAALPRVLVLSPEDAADAASWPQFGPAVVTDEARRRAELYEQRRRRQEAAAGFAGTRDEFLRQVGTRVTIAPAEAASAGRLHELSVRTHQLNSSAVPVSEAEFGELIREPGHLVVAVRLADDFGDDGLVGAAVTERGAGAWSVPLVMMSCRALGRGVLDSLLAWLCRCAARAGAQELQVPCLVTDRNVPMRLALAAAGMRAEAGTRGADGRAVFARSLDGELPALPDWVSASAVL